MKFRPEEQVYRDTGVRTNPLRSNGVTAKKFATEAFMDEVARKHGQDLLAGPMIH